VLFHRGVLTTPENAHLSAIICAGIAPICAK